MAKKLQLHLFDEQAYKATFQRRWDTFHAKNDERIRELEGRIRRDEREQEKDLPLDVFESIWKRIAKNEDEHTDLITKFPTEEEQAQWRREAELAAYARDYCDELLMNLQPGQAVVLIPGAFSKGIPVKIPLPPDRRGNDDLFEYAVERWGVPRVSAYTADGVPSEESSATNSFSDEQHEQFLRQKPKRRPRNRD